MASIPYQPVTPSVIYSGLAELKAQKSNRLSTITLENTPSGNSYMDLFANLIRQHGKHPANYYAKMLNVSPRKLEGAIQCMSGIGPNDWINEYLRLVACDLLEHTKFTFKDIGKILGFSSSSFSQFFQSYHHMQPSEYRNFKKTGQKQGYFYS